MQRKGKSHCYTHRDFMHGINENKALERKTEARRILKLLKKASQLENEAIPKLENEAS